MSTASAIILMLWLSGSMLAGVVIAEYRSGRRL